MLSISIIIPFYENNLEDIETTLNSVLKIKNLNNYEIIIVDDGSSSSKHDLLNKLINEEKKKKFQISLIKHNLNKGLGEARNTGLAESAKEFVTFLDCGDELSSNFIIESELILSEGKYDVISFKTIAKNNLQEANQLYDSNLLNKLKQKELVKNFLELNIPNQATSRLISKNYIKKNNISFLKRHVIHEDLYFTSTLFSFEGKYFFSNKVMYIWNKQKGSLSTTFTLKHVRDFFFMNSELYKSIPIEFDDFLREKRFLFGKFFKYNRYETFSDFKLHIISLFIWFKNSKHKIKIFKETNIFIYPIRAYWRINYKIGFKNYLKFNKTLKYNLGVNKYFKILLICLLLKPLFILHVNFKRLHISSIASFFMKTILRIHYKIGIKKLLNYNKTLKKSMGNAKYYNLLFIYLTLRFFLPLNYIKKSLKKIQQEKKKKKSELKIKKYKNIHVDKKYIDIRIGITKSEENKIKSLKNKFNNERCFIIGNGPSLNKIDLSLIKNENTFGVNSIFYKFYDENFKPKFYVVEDKWVMNDRAEEINKFDVEYKFIPSHYRDKIFNYKNVYFFPMNTSFYRFKTPKFSENSHKDVFCGQTVTYMNMQLAYYLGFKKIYLIGMDFNYEKPSHVVENGKTWLSTGDDPNHFHKDYFGAGKRWHDPQLERVLINYKFAHKFFKEKKIQIFNATVGGKLEEFPRLNFESLF